MPLGFATLPLLPAQLRALADGDYSIVDQAVRTPGLLIIQSPDPEAIGDRGSAFGDSGAGPNADRPTPNAEQE